MPNNDSGRDAIRALFKEYEDNYQFLMDKQQISIATDYKSQYSKVMLLSAASYFESKVIQIMYEMLNPQRCLINKGFMEKKALKRQYHTLFNWEQTHANQFFSLFGTEFQTFMSKKVSEDEELNNSIGDFMALGSLRNQLVHRNYATFQLQLTAEDIFSKFENALKFVDSLIPLSQEFRAN
ncbi:HEPN domain-containing protein [Vibrio splendidus]